MQEKTIKPRKLFALTLVVYFLLILSLIAACVFVKYPISSKAIILDFDQKNHIVNLQIDPIAKLKVNSILILKDHQGNKYDTEIVNIIYNMKKHVTEISLSIKSNGQKFSYKKNERIETIKVEPLFFVLIERMK